MTTGRTLGATLVIGGARLRDVVGLTGIAGLILIATATGLFGFAWHRHRADMSSVAPTPANERAEARAGDSRPHPLVLPSASDVPTLLSRVERAAVDQGLGWPKAEYSVNAASNEAPSSLEVRCTLKGPYPSVRKFVTALLQDEPALTLRDFSVTRTSVDAPGVEARMTIVVYIGDNAASMQERSR